MKKLLAIAFLLLPMLATAQIKYNNFTTNSSPVATIGQGGTGQSTATLGLTALGAGGGSTILTPFIQPANGSTTATVLFPATSSTASDQAFTIEGSPFTSGASVGLKMLTSNTQFTPLTSEGYGVWDAIAFQFDCVGWQALASDGPGWDLIVGNTPEPIVIAHAFNGGNIPNLYMTGDITNGAMVEIPYYDGINSHIQPLPLRYDVTGTNYFFVQTNEPKLFEVNQNNGNVEIYNPNPGVGAFTILPPVKTSQGVIITGGQLANNVAFNSSDANPVTLNAAVIQASAYRCAVGSLTPGASAYTDSSGNQGWMMTQGGRGIALEDGGAIIMQMGSAANTGVADGGFFPCGGTGLPAANDGVFDIGAISHTWKQVATQALVCPISTNKMCGNFFLNGTSTVNVGNTSITSTNIIIDCQEYGANGGTQAGTCAIQSITPGTGFAVKGIALDTSYVRYHIITNF